MYFKCMQTAMLKEVAFFLYLRYLPTNLVGTGHATQGDFSKLEEDKQVSIEDQDIIRDDNHISSSVEDSDDVEPAQPYSFVEHNNGDRD